MADPRWMSPPEVIAAIFEMGPGPASVLANQLVWITETINHELAVGLSAANTAATAAQWTGLGGAGSGQCAAGLNGGLQTLIGWVTHKVAITQAAADAYLLAASTVIPSVLSQTNRDETLALHATNFFGQNTPGIVERDTEYFGEHWPHNSSVGWSYSSVLTGLIGSLGVPPPPAPMGASPTAPVAMSSAVAESAAQTAAEGGLQPAAGAAEAPAKAASGAMTGELGSFLQEGPQLATSMAEPVKSVAGAPAQALQSFSSAPQALMGAFSAVRPSDALGVDAAIPRAGGESIRAVSGSGAAGGVAGGGGYPGAGLTSYNRPTSTFSPEPAGRPAGRAGVLNAAELRSGPTTSAATGGSPAPMSPAGMLGRGAATDDRNDVTRARVVVGAEAEDPPGGSR